MTIKNPNVSKIEDSKMNIIILPPSNGEVSIDEVVSNILEPRSNQSISEVQRPRTHVTAYEPIYIDRKSNVDWSLITGREREVFRLIILGEDNKSIASSLKISEKTVKNHTASIIQKLGVKNRTHSIAQVVQGDLLH